MRKALLNRLWNRLSNRLAYSMFVNWRLTKTTAFDQIEDMLIDFKRKLDAQSTQLEMIIIDDCCTVCTKKCYRTNYTKHTLANKGTDVWNNLPTQYKKIQFYGTLFNY